MITIQDSYVVCPNAAMIRLNKRAPIIVNMTNKTLQVERREIKPVTENNLVTLASGVISAKCESAFAIDLLRRNEVGVLILIDKPTVDQLNRLTAKKWIILNNNGLYQVYSKDGKVLVKNENNRRIFKQGETNVVPKTNPIENG